MESLRIYSIFDSIDGEVNRFYQGRRSTFVRLAGCNISCRYCDTKYAQDKLCGGEMTYDEIISQIEKNNCKKVTITGGEPLLQIPLAEFLVILESRNYFISVETNGSLSPFQTQLKNLCYVMDWKLPSSGMEHHMREMNFFMLREGDFVKFVINDKRDFLRSVEVMKDLQKGGCIANFAYSPVFNVLDPDELVHWIKMEEIDVIVNLQLHKYIWPDISGFNER